VLELRRVLLPALLLLEPQELKRVVHRQPQLAYLLQ
jgi:hypothetical protein